MLANPFEGAPAWFPYWPGEVAVIVASGPSAQDVPLELAKGKARFIAVNNSWQLAPWADVLYACDYAWWQSADGCPDFQGLKLTIDKRAARIDGWNIQRVECNKGSDQPEFKRVNCIGWGGNSGFGSFNLAAQFGCSKIILVGYDMTIEYGRHWHADHPAGMSNPQSGNIERWRRAVDGIANYLPPQVRVFNCSAISALRNYPKMTFQEALAA